MTIWVYLADNFTLAYKPRLKGARWRGGFKSLGEIHPRPDAISIITPPKVTEAVVEEAGRLGIRHVWMQPGAESDAAIARATELGMNVIAGGPCLLVVLGFRDGT